MFCRTFNEVRGQPEPLRSAKSLKHRSPSLGLALTTSAQWVNVSKPSLPSGPQWSQLWGKEGAPHSRWPADPDIHVSTYRGRWCSTEQGEPMSGARLQGQRWQKPLLRIQISVPLPEMNLYFFPILKVGGWANYGVIWPFHQTNYPCQEHHSMANRPKWEQIPGKDPMSCPPVLPSAFTAALDWFTQITDPCPSMGHSKQALVL